MLFLRELKKIVLSIPFLIVISVMMIMIISQNALIFNQEDKINMPVKGENYGTYGPGRDIAEMIMPSATDSLYTEFCANSYTAYPIGFYKNVKLNDKKQAEMAFLLSELTGLDVKELTGKKANTNEIKDNEIQIDGNGSLTTDENGNYKIEIPNQDILQKRLPAVSPRADLHYDQFKEIMKKADKLIGGGSSYQEARMIRTFGAVPITYDEAMAQYELTRDVDKFTGGYSRLFSDYIQVGGLSVLTVLLAVVLCLKDRLSKMSELVFTRKISSAKLVLIRYAAIVVAIMLPVILLSYVSGFSVFSLYDNVALDYFAPIKYSMGWVMPSVMMSAAIGMFFTELTNTPIAIAIQGVWWFVDVNANVDVIYGGYSLFALSPRHNSIKYTQLLLDNFNTLVANRILFALAGLLILGATIFIYSLKRKGLLNGNGKINSFIKSLSNRKVKSKA